MSVKAVKIIEPRRGLEPVRPQVHFVVNSELLRAYRYVPTEAGGQAGGRRTSHEKRSIIPSVKNVATGDVRCK
jgi:hypothetical protein